MAVFFIGFLSIQLETVSGVRNIDLALRRERILNADALQDMSVPLHIAPSPAAMFDPNESQKRRVRRGSDPIHNKC